ncbi:MAG: AAA family ATPase [Deltaproteobacteria bacterium]|nr:AAA family ATPase [Deltaproteobacteria bacterium]
MASADDILEKHRQWLALEEAAQREEWERAKKHGIKVLESEGYAIRGLLARDDRSGFLGRSLIIFERTYGAERGGFRMSASDPVIVRHQAEPEQSSMKAVLHRITPRSVELLIDDAPEAWLVDEVCSIELGPNDVTFQRLRAGIEAAAQLEGAKKTLRDRALGIVAAPPPKKIAAGTEMAKRSKQRKEYNSKQNEALDRIAEEPSLFLLHGPPGTGKTTVLAQAIKEAVDRGERALVGTPSNQAVDNMAHALIARGIDVLRLGHPARIDPALHAHTLEGKLEAHPQKNVADDLFKQARKLFREASQKKLQGRSLDAREQAFALRREGKQLVEEARQIEKRALAHVLQETPVVCATLTGLREDLLEESSFQLGVIDEATQAVVPAIYPLLTRVDRLVLGGDHRQLGPTVLSQKAEQDGMGKSAFERLMQSKTPPPSVMLEEQYRMHEDIMRYPSQALYEGKLVAAASVKARKLDGDWPALLFVDTAGRGFDEAKAGEQGSTLNEGEAALAIDLARKIAATGLAPEHIGILSPYAAQVQQLRGLAGDDAFEINSIDGFQGREKDAIIVTLVRSNEDRDIGFLSELRRLNVALTRAKKSLVVIGDSATITAHPFYSGFVDFAIALGAHKSAWDFS